jgi:hypothetical protein
VRMTGTRGWVGGLEGVAQRYARKVGVGFGLVVGLGEWQCSFL